MSDEHDSWFMGAFGVDLGAAAGRLRDGLGESVGQAGGPLAAGTETQGVIGGMASRAGAAVSGAAGAAVAGAAAVVESASRVVSGGAGGIGGLAQGAAGRIAGAVQGLAGGVGESVSGGIAGAGAAIAPAGAGAEGDSPASPAGSAPLDKPIGGSVGKGGKNAPADVMAIQRALGIAVDGKVGPQTIAAIEAHQRKMGGGKADGRVDVGGRTEQSLMGSGPPRPTDAARAAHAEEATGPVEPAADELDAAARAATAVEEADDSGQGTPALPEEGDEGLLQRIEAAAKGLVPSFDIPGVGVIDVGANLSRAASEVVAANAPKIPLLRRAEALVKEAETIVDAKGVPTGTLTLPPPTGSFEGECCSREDLDKFRLAIDGPRTGVQLAINAFNDADRGVVEAAQQGKFICAASFAACVFGMAKSRLGIGACLAASVTCIGASGPVQNAIRQQAKAEADLEVANGVLERALSNHLNCFQRRCRPILEFERDGQAPDAGSEDGPVIELDDPPVDEPDARSSRK